LFFYRPSPLLFLIGIMAVPSLWAAWKYDPNSPEALAYRDVPDATRYEYMLMYLGLTGFLAIMSYEAHQMLRHGSF
jgi:hypothetical protein